MIYVTHSPFLLDKNHSERIRVLEKGNVSDGTRVVPNVNRNHYEPLRSAFGAFVGETAFVGAVNLLVEAARCLTIIDVIRDEHGIPLSEHRHPDLASGKAWQILMSDGDP